MKVAIILLSTFVIDENSDLFKRKFLTNNSLRIEQYIVGLKNLKKNCSKYNYDIYLIDNSLKYNDLMGSLRDVIGGIRYVYCDRNNMGRLNKGAGMVEVWRENIWLMREYDYIFHFEPRQKMVSDILMRSFEERKGNYFKVDKTGEQFYTGLFVVESKKLIDFVKNVDIESMVRDNLSLERLMYDFFRDKKYNILGSLGLIWYDSYKNNFETHV